MCLAIYKPSTTPADWDAYKNGHAQNDDSWGFAAVVNGSLVTRCGIGNFDEFREAFEPYATCQAIIHFRWATHGKTNTDNCHPFMVADDLAVIHNGIVGIKCNVNASMSDTWHFNELILKPMHACDPEFYNRSDVIFSQELAHASSKFVFLRADGDYQIWNAGDGDWADDGHWYSNDSHKSCRWTLGTAFSSARPTSPPPKSDRSWVEVDDGRWAYEDEASSAAADTLRGSPFDDDDTEDQYTAMRMEELMSYGFSRSTLLEVIDLMGHWGIEALHDAM